MSDSHLYTVIECESSSKEADGRLLPLLSMVLHPHFVPLFVSPLMMVFVRTPRSERSPVLSVLLNVASQQLWFPPSKTGRNNPPQPALPN